MPPPALLGSDRFVANSVTEGLDGIGAVTPMLECFPSHGHIFAEFRPGEHKNVVRGVHREAGNV
jgi:hypothetical protein